MAKIIFSLKFNSSHFVFSSRDHHLSIKRDGTKWGRALTEGKNWWIQFLNLKNFPVFDGQRRWRWDKKYIVVRKVSHEGEKKEKTGEKLSSFLFWIWSDTMNFFHLLSISHFHFNLLLSHPIHDTKFYSETFLLLFLSGVHETHLFFSNSNKYNFLPVFFLSSMKKFSRANEDCLPKKKTKKCMYMYSVDHMRGYLQWRSEWECGSWKLFYTPKISRFEPENKLSFFSTFLLSKDTQHIV